MYRSSQTSRTDEDNYFSDSDDADFVDALDDIEHLNSPEKVPPASPSSSRASQASSSSSATIIPVTPSRLRAVRTETSSVKRFKYISDEMANIKLKNSPTSGSMLPPERIKKRSLAKLSRKGKSPAPIIIIESSDEDNSETDRHEVSALLTDTDASSAYEASIFDTKSPTTSMSSIYSLPSAGSNWSVLSLNSSTSSLGKKRDAEHRPSAGSPSKVRKVGGYTPQTRVSSHSARATEPSRRLKIRPSSSLPMPVDDVFSTPSAPPSNFLLRTQPIDLPPLQSPIYVGDDDVFMPSVVQPSVRRLAKAKQPPHTPSEPTRSKSPPIYVDSDDDLLHPPMPPSTPLRSQKKPPPSAPYRTTTLNEKDFVAEFLQSRTGVDLPPNIIEHHTDIQKLFDKAEISWAVQYEVARGVSLGLWDWDQIKHKINVLKGPSAKVAYRVRHIILEKPLQGSPDLSLWEEFDREDLAILENCERGLGLMGEWKGEADWYGGRIQQIARVLKTDDGYKVQLDPPEKRRSHRLARYLGSRRIIQLRVPDELVLEEYQSIQQFLSQKFILCGRIFVPLHAKDSSVYMVETNEAWEGRQPGLWCGDQYRKSFADIVYWHNPLDLNKDQPISKWATRFALALSNSIPVLIFEEDNILQIDDIYATDWSLKNGKKAPAEKTMTDGCGLINLAAMKAIARKLGYPTRSSGIQARAFNGKGMFITHPTNDDPEPKLWIRKSQAKITYDYPLDRAHRILDLLSVSQPSSSINLSRQSIVNLAYNGVPHNVLVNLMVDGLTDEVKPLMEWDGPNAMVALWNAINRLGNVSGTRVQRSAAGLSRALGLAGREWGHDDVGMTDKAAALKEALEEVAKPVYTGRSEHSGLPAGMHETAVEMLQSGLRPERVKFLQHKLRYIMQEKITSTVEKYQIPLSQSLNTFVVPDPLGVLEEGQIYYRSSQAMIDPESQTAFNTITGDVLLGRYPVRLPSDIQKVKAIDVPALHDWPDVIIVSTKGNFSLASLLSGGDYDGDELFIIREASLVEPFKSQSLTKEPANLKADNFEGQVESVKKFAERAMALSPQDAQMAFQEVLLLGLNNSKVGLYSTFHDYAVYEYGYANPEAVRLAYMFNTLLDSSKTGLRLKPGIYEQDSKRFSNKIPPAHQGSTFILHELKLAGSAAGDDLRRKYDNISGVNDQTPDDQDLRAPYDIAASHALKVSEERKMTVFLDELKLIRNHVDASYDAFMASIRPSDTGNPSSQKKQKKARRDKDNMQRPAQMFAEDIPEVLLIRNVEEVKASYAYHLSSGAFPFSVAFRQLCDIKAHADPQGIAPSTRPFDEAKAITAPFQRFLKRTAIDGA